MLNKIAALFVERKGTYTKLEGVDVWDESRDARLYAGPWPVVAHPPCARWCQLAGLVQHRYGHQIGDDGGCFANALSSVRIWGGVLEHPAYSRAWTTHDLNRPPKNGGWIRADEWGYTCQVAQRNYGHRARKLTWLYACATPLPDLIWGKGPPVECWVGWGDYDKYASVERLSKTERNATPGAFRDLLIEMARGVYATEND